jgi:hypothetical protein
MDREHVLGRCRKAHPMPSASAHIYPPECPRTAAVSWMAACTHGRSGVSRAPVSGFRRPAGVVPRFAAVRGAVAACGRPAGRVRVGVPSRQDPDRRPLFSYSLSDSGLTSLVAFSV